MRTLIDITFVIPVYNAEKFLAECLESVLRQNVSKEVICINDGSTDQSLSILKEYASKYPEIRIIDKENEGVSKARNRGIEQAKGRYLWFVDADDYLLVKNMKELINTADTYQADIIRGLIWKGDELGQARLLYTASDNVIEQFQKQNKYAELISNGDFLFKSIQRGFSPKIINGFYSTQFLKENDCYFPDREISHSEDEYFEICVFSNKITAKIYEVSVPFYFYRHNETSSTNFKLKQFEGSLSIFPLLLDLSYNIEDKFLALDPSSPIYANTQKLLWSVRFIALRLNATALLSIYPELSNNEKIKANHLIKKKNLTYLDELKYMILACESHSFYVRNYSNIQSNISMIKALFNFNKE